MAKTRKQPSIHIPNKKILCMEKSFKSLVINGKAKDRWIPAVINGRKNTINT